LDTSANGQITNVATVTDPVTGEQFTATDTDTVLAAGDANGDLQFDQLDVVQVLQAGKYLTGQPAGWSDGNWNGGHQVAGEPTALDKSPQHLPALTHETPDVGSQVNEEVTEEHLSCGRFLDEEPSFGQPMVQVGKVLGKLSGIEQPTCAGPIRANEPKNRVTLGELPSLLSSVRAVHHFVVFGSRGARLLCFMSEM
jgi:hypothetical protein